MAPDIMKFNEGEALAPGQLEEMQRNLLALAKDHKHTGNADGPKLGKDSLGSSAVDTDQVKNKAITKIKLADEVVNALQAKPTTVACVLWHDWLPLGGGVSPASLPAGGGAVRSGGETRAPLASAGGMVRSGSEVRAPLAATPSPGVGDIWQPPVVLPPGHDKPMLPPGWIVRQGAEGNVDKIYLSADSPPNTYGVIRIDFVKPYKDAFYAPIVTPGWSELGMNCFIYKQDPAYLELVVPIPPGVAPPGENEVIVPNFNFSLVVFGDLTS